MKKLWITYSWLDNEEGDVNYIAQELRKHVDIKLDRLVLESGKRIWSQIESNITDANESDAWLIYATQNSLKSEACKEEYAYALDRALNYRGINFPIIGLFPTGVEKNLIPAGIRTRLYVSLSDPDWKERIISTVNGSSLNIATPKLNPYVLEVHQLPELPGEDKYVIEIRPRAGTWSPFFIAVPADDYEKDELVALHGPKKIIPTGGLLYLNQGIVTNQRGRWKYSEITKEATPTQSYFLFCKKIPSEITFGSRITKELYEVYFDV